MAGELPTPVEDVVETIHGTVVHDHYRWLEAGGGEAVSAWVAAQNARTRSVLDAGPRRAALERRLRQAMDVGSLGGFLPRGRRLFSHRRPPGADQPLLHVSDLDGRGERVLLDPAAMGADAATAIDWWVPARDGELVAVGISEGGSENSTLVLVRTESGALLADRIAGCRWPALVFEPGNGGLLYSRQPTPGSVPAGEEMYHRHVWRHLVGEDPAADVRLFGEGRDKLDFPASLSMTDDGGWTVLTVAQGWDRTAVFLRSGQGPFQPIFEGLPSELHAWFSGGRLLGHTNHLAANYRLVEIDPRRPSADSWRDLVAEGEHVLAGATATAGALYVEHLVDAASEVRRHGLDGSPGEPIELPRPATVTAAGAQASGPECYLTVETFTEPARVLEVGGRVREVRRLDVPSGFDAARHPVRQVFYASKDGNRVPMFLVGRARSAGPVLLTGYGGFNISRTPTFLATSVPFLEAGGLVAVAGLRGGGEYGERWHRAGMLGSKQNVFDDFAAAAEWLIGEGLCAPSQLGIVGGSNGGLLVGVAMTQRPELFGCVVCRVPLLDMVRYERFQVAQLWAAEYGSAADPPAFGWLYAYSPYHHVEDGRRYPRTLLTAGEEDSRVDPLHARKFGARLQAADPDGGHLLRVEPRAGHGQGKPVAKLVPEEADILAFVLDTLDPPPVP